MAITAVDKMKINKYLREHALGDIYYLDMCDAVGKKTKITEMEFLEFFTDSVVGEFRKDSKISIKQLTKYIVTVNNLLSWINKSGSNVNEEIIDKIKSFGEFYNDYLTRTGVDKDLDFVNECLNPILENVNKMYPSEIQAESVAKYISKVKDLEAHVEKLKKQLTESSNSYNRLEESHERKSRELDSLKDEITLLKKDNRLKDKETKQLSDIINSLNNEIFELGIMLSDTQVDNAALYSYREKYEVLTVEVDELRKIVEEENASKIRVIESETRQKELESLIYQKLILERADIDDILTFIEKQGFVSDKNEISCLLKKMRSKIMIDDSVFSIKPSYKIITPTLLQNGQFTINIPDGCQYYDVMLTSDLHIREFDSNVLAGFDRVTDYCVKNGINLIVDLGDFFHGTKKTRFTYEDAIENYNIVEQSISLIPKVDGIYHANLGGNHEKGISRYGFDPLQLLTSQREDFINLGYVHSNILFNGSRGNIGSFGIHHPSDFKFPIEIEEYIVGYKNMEEYLNGIYSNQGKSRDDSYIDIFGHTHKNQMNYPSAYYYLGSFFGKGPCHLRVYFEDNKDIKYMVFMPLSTGMVKNNEIVYQKVLTK